MYYKILTYPGAPKNAVIPPKKEHGRYSVYTREPARNNQANQSVLELMAHHLKVDSKSLRIVKGHQSPQKTILDLRFEN